MLSVYLKGEREEVRGREATFTERLPGIELGGLEIMTLRNMQISLNKNDFFWFSNFFWMSTFKLFN